jgi:Tfp pilus assembly protein PilF
MAWGYEQVKDNKSALKMYKKALRLAPSDKKEGIKKAMTKLK